MISRRAVLSSMPLDGPVGGAPVSLNSFRTGERADRPWGEWEVIATGEEDGLATCTKEIRVRSGGQLSVQSHANREEHWTVQQGVATVLFGPTLEDMRSVVLERGESIVIPRAWIHSLANHGHELLVVREKQKGPDLREDDIVRYADQYGRVDPAFLRNHLTGE